MKATEGEPSGGKQLGSAAPFLCLNRRHRILSQRTRVGGPEPDQNFVGGVLQPCVRLVQLAGCFTRQLAELVAIGHVRECPKNQIGTHCSILLVRFHCPGRASWRRRCNTGKPRESRAVPKFNFLFNRRATDTCSSKKMHICRRTSQKAHPYRGFHCQENRGARYLPTGKYPSAPTHQR